MTFSRVALVVGSLAVAACTNDYDAFLGGAGGGAASGPGATTGAGGAGTTTSTTASTASGGGASTSSSSAGTGGDGGGGATGASSSSGGGGGQGGGELLGTEPCEGIQLQFDQDLDDEIDDGGDVWGTFDTSGGSLQAGDGTLRVGLDEGGGEAVGVLTTTGRPLSSCSVRTRVLRVDGADQMDGAITAFFGGYGDWGGPDDRRRGFEVRVARDDPGDVTCEAGVRLEGPGEWDVGPGACDPADLAEELRLRHTGSQLCFDSRTGGAPDFTVLRCVDAPDRLDVALGARGFGDVEVVFDPVR